MKVKYLEFENFRNLEKNKVYAHENTNVIFGENTHSSGFGEREINKGEKIVADIEFVWPQIQASSYFLTLGLREGDNEMQHTIQCWAHNIFEFRNISNLPDHGLFNQKIENFSIKRKDDL